MNQVTATLNIGGNTLSVNPIFGDDVKLKISTQENQIFHRQKIDGKFTFVNEDFDLIANCSDEVEFVLSIYREGSLVGSASFIRADCTLNYDDRICSVQLTTTDRYEKILAGLDNVYNLVKLAPKTQPLTLTKRPVLQFYMLGDNKITNSLGNMAFEVDASATAPEKTEAEILDCGFEKIYHLSIAEITSCGYTSLNLKGSYEGKYTGVGSVLTRKDEAYYIKYETFSDMGYSKTAWRIYDSSDALIRPTGYPSGFFYTEGDVVDGYLSGISIYVYIPGYATSVQGSCNFNNRTIFVRVLSDYGLTMAGETKIKISDISDDVALETYNYTYAWTVGWLSLQNNIIYSTDTQDDPTEYGVDDNGKYFVKPTTQDARTEIYPIGWSMWVPMSFWFENSYGIYASLDISPLNVTYTLPDAYPLYSAIQKLLAEIDSSVTYTMSELGSIFFAEAYDDMLGESSILYTPRMRKSQLYITPITNIKKTRYEQSAQKGDITLGQILDMLRNVYQCYWWIDDNNRLRIEHILYFKQGYSYGMGEPTPNIDVTAMLDLPNKKMWDFGTNEVTFDRQRCPSRYEFAWGDESTQQFKGYAIDIEDKRASKDTKNDAVIANFVADIDYVVINPSGVSDDIYALIEADNNYKVAIPEIRLDDTRPVYTMQNGYCSLLFAEKEYYNYDLGGWKAKCNGVYLDVKGVREYIKQDLTFPMTLSQLNSLGLIRTGVGDGFAEDITADINTLSVDASLILNGAKDIADVLSIITIPYAQGTAYMIQSSYKGWLSVTYAVALNNAVSDPISATIGPEDGVVVGAVSDGTPIILSAFPAKEYYFISEPFLKANTNMTYTRTWDYNNQRTTLVFQGGGDSYDWGYVQIKLHTTEVSITMTASTENAYDLGYGNATPCCTRDEAYDAEKVVSGTGVETFSLTMGDTMYLGYVKDESASSNQDKITIVIEEI